MSIRSYEITRHVNQAQELDIATVLQNDKLDLYQFNVCCDISLAYTANFLEKHPEVISRIQKLFESNDTYYLQRDLKTKFNKELDEDAILASYAKLKDQLKEDKGTWHEGRPESYRAAGFDPYMLNNEKLIAELISPGALYILKGMKEKGLEEAFNKKLKEKGIDKIELDDKFAKKTDDDLLGIWRHHEGEEIADEAIKEYEQRDRLENHMDIYCEILYPESRPTDTFLQERHAAAEKLNGWFNFEESFQKTEKRIKQSSGEECFRICMTPMSEYDEYKAAQTLKTVFEAYYDQTSFLSQRCHNTDLYYTNMKDSSAFSYAKSALKDIGKYHDQPELEQHFENRIGDLLQMRTIDGKVPTYGNGEPNRFSHYSGFGSAVFQKKMIVTVLKDPTSEESQFYFKNKNVLNPGYVYDYHGSINSTYRIIAEGLIVSHPDFALKLLKDVENSCDATYLGKVYDVSQNKALIPMIADQLKKTQKEDGTYTLYDKLLAHKYSQQSDNQVLKEISGAQLAKDIVIDDKIISLLKEDVDYKPVLEDSKNASVQNMVIDLAGPQSEDMDIMQQCLSKFSNLESIEFKMAGYDSSYPEMDANIFLAHQKLKTLNIKRCVVRNAEKLLDLPCLEVIDKGIFSNPEAFWSSLIAHRPEHLEKIGFTTEEEVEEEKVKALMEQHPDLYIDWCSSILRELKDRNEAIIIAKKSRSPEDIANVIDEKGFVEYLKITDPKDRPTFEDLNKKVATRHYDAQNFFEYMHNAYASPCYTSSGKEYRAPEKYTEALTQVAELCGLKEIKKEVELVKSVQEKRVIEHLKSLKPEERPTLLSLFQDNTITTEDGKPIIESIKKTYQEEYAGTMAEMLTVFGAPKEEMALLEGDKDLASIAKQYAERQQYNQTAAVSKSAFERWKQQQHD